VRICFLIFVWLCLTARAGLAWLTNTVPDMVISPPAIPSSVAGRVLWDSVRRYEPLFYDSVLSSQMVNPFNSDYHDSAKEDLNRAVFHSLRTMAGNIVLWEVRAPNVSGAISDSVGTPEQDVINPFSMTPYKYGQSWWDRVGSSHRVLLGLRPFNEDPYAYLASGLGGGVLFNFRYYYYHFDSHKVELVAVMPVSESLRFTTGVVYNSVTQNSLKGGCFAGTLQVEKNLAFSSSKSQTIVFGAVRLGQLIDGDRASQRFECGLTHRF